MQYKNLANQTTTEKMYLLKLMAQQLLGAQWTYYEKIKNTEGSFAFLKEKSLMQQMKATQSALKFTSKTAAKLYANTYQTTLKEIKTYTGISTGFPELTETEEDNQTNGDHSNRFLKSEIDAVVIPWTPIKFFLPARTLRDKGMATQRHTESLIAKLYYKVVGYYADPNNWEKGKLIFYLREIHKESTSSEIIKILEPLKKDLALFLEVYQPFKFGKTSLSKDVVQDADSFDDAMGVESFESQVNTLYWYEYIYRGMEMFLFRYFLTLVTATTSELTINYLTTLFNPVLALAIEIKNTFLGSLETDHSKKKFRKPFLKLKAEKAKEPIGKKLKTKQGIFETYACNFKVLDKMGMDSSFSEMPGQSSQWWSFVKHYILGIDRPVQTIWNPEDLKGEVFRSDSEEQSAKIEAFKEKVNIQEEILNGKSNNLNDRLAKIVEEKKKIVAIEKRIEQGETFEEERRTKFEKFKAKILQEEQRLSEKKQKLETEFQNLEKLKVKKEKRSRDTSLDRKEKQELIDQIEAEERKLNRIEIRQYTLMQIMAMLINCTNFQRQTKLKILERFEDRINTDKKMEENRIEEINQQTEKKVRDMERKLSKMRHLKQEDTASAFAQDIEKLKKSVADKCNTIRNDSMVLFQKRRDKLKKLFDSISKESAISEGRTSKLILKLTKEIDPDNNFHKSFVNYMLIKMRSQYAETLEPFYKNIFEILNPTIQEKVLIIQSLEKSGRGDAVPIALSEKEQFKFEKMISDRKDVINQLMPGVLEAKAVCLAKTIPLERLLYLRIDNQTLVHFFKMKIIAPGAGKPISIPEEIFAKLIELNSLINPVPIHNLLKEQINEKDPQKSVDITHLCKLLKEG